MSARKRQLRFDKIRQTTLIDASPAEVYGAYLDPVKHARFTGSPASGSPEVGGEFSAWDGYITGKYLELEEGKRILQEWMTTEWPPHYPPSVVELTFRPRGNKTEVVMVHSKVPAEQAADYAKGWTDFYWAPLREFFGAGKTKKPSSSRRL